MLIVQVIDTPTKIQLKIETLRQEMIQSGLNEGLTSKRTIEISNKLDDYIVKYQQMKRTEQK